MNYFNLNLECIFNNYFNNSKFVHPFIQIFKNIWADNGDSISIQYAGTASCNSRITKKGKNGLMGLFKHGYVSLSRLYQGNFEDGFKQKCIDLFLNKNTENNLLGNE